MLLMLALARHSCGVCTIQIMRRRSSVCTCRQCSTDSWAAVAAARAGTDPIPAVDTARARKPKRRLDGRAHVTSATKAASQRQRNKRRRKHAGGRPKNLDVLIAKATADPGTRYLGTITCFVKGKGFVKQSVLTDSGGNRADCAAAERAEPSNDEDDTGSSSPSMSDGAVSDASSASSSDAAERGTAATKPTLDQVLAAAVAARDALKEEDGGSSADSDYQPLSDDDVSSGDDALESSLRKALKSDVKALGPAVVAAMNDLITVEDDISHDATRSYVVYTPDDKAYCLQLLRSFPLRNGKVQYTAAAALIQRVGPYFSRMSDNNLRNWSKAEGAAAPPLGRPTAPDSFLIECYNSLVFAVFDDLAAGKDKDQKILDARLKPGQKRLRKGAARGGMAIMANIAYTYEDVRERCKAKQCVQMLIFLRHKQLLFVFLAFCMRSECAYRYGDELKRNIGAHR